MDRQILKRTTFKRKMKLWKNTVLVIKNEIIWKIYKFWKNENLKNTCTNILSSLKVVKNDGIFFEMKKYTFKKNWKVNCQCF